MKRVRARRACLNCRKRKLKCEVGAGDQCGRCKSDEIECVVPQKSNRGGFANVLAGRQKKLSNQQVNQPDLSLNNSPAPELEFGGSSMASSNNSDVSSPGSLHSNSLLREALQQQMYTVNDAVEILNQFNPCEPGCTSRQHIPDIIQQGLISEAEGQELIQFFYFKMEPLFPFVRQVYSHQNLRSHAFLLTMVCTIAAKYSHRADIYAKLKPALTSLLFTAPWADMKSMSKLSSGSGTCIALLLGIEWLIDEEGGPACVEQYNRASWVQLGVAVRIAQYTRCLDHQSLTEPTIAAVGTALTSIDAVVGCRLGLGPSMRLLNHGGIPTNLKARCGITELLTITYSTLYTGMKPQSELEIALDRVAVKFKDWEVKHQDEMNIQNWETKSIEFEYQHAVLYAFSIALSQNIVKYVKKACIAAQRVIEFEVQTFAIDPEFVPPMRWIVRLIHAAVFLAKVSEQPQLNIENQKIRQSVRDAANLAKICGEYKFQIMAPYVKLLTELADYVNNEEDLDFGALDAFLAPFLEF